MNEESEVKPVAPNVRQNAHRRHGYAPQKIKLNGFECLQVGQAAYVETSTQGMRRCNTKGTNPKKATARTLRREAKRHASFAPMFKPQNPPA